MNDILRQEIATLATTIVVKVGTRVLTDGGPRINEKKIEDLVGELHRLIDSGRRVLLVSSGAVGAGCGRLGLEKRPTDLAHLQAVAAIGQSALVETYHRKFAVHGYPAAQVLLTADVLEHRARYLNARNTLLSLLDFGAVPIINENDTVSVDELRVSFGDNDQLAAVVTNLVQAPLMVLLSDIDGLYDGDPSQPEARLIPTVTTLDRAVFDLVCDKKTGLSKGGMASKLEAARKAIKAGANVIIANGRERGTLDRIRAGEAVGTLFLAENQRIAARKRWIGFSIKPQGAVTIDDGACRAVRQQGRSLLPIGIVGVEGAFGQGDLICLRDLRGLEIARGLTNYSAEEVQRIHGLRTDRILEMLGYCPYEEVVHRDNMLVL